MNKKLLHIIDKSLLKIYENYKTDPDRIGVLVGDAGVALYCIIYGSSFNNDTAYRYGVDIIDSCINRINKGYNFPTYCSGICGFAWTINFLDKNHLIDLDLEETLLQLDPFLYQTMKLNMKHGDYDFLHGVLGYANYFIDRYNNTNIPLIKIQLKTILEEVLVFLEETAVIDKDGMYKWSLLREKKQNVFDMGLSHGAPSIIIFLTKIIQANINKDYATTILKKAIKYVLTLESTNKSLSMFPSRIELSKPVEYNSRLAWCYGDLGIALAFWKSSIILNDDNLKNKSIEIIEHTTLRLADDENYVEEITLCHGALGVLRIIDYLEKETNIVGLKKVKELWINRTIEQIEKKNFFKQNNINTEDFSLLLGYSGVGLSVISLLSNENFSWDECLLIN